MSEDGNSRQRILEAAGLIFAGEGYAGAKVEHIAKLAKVNKAALYYHVGGKAALYEAVLIENIRLVAARLETAIQGISDPGEALEALVRTLVSVFEQSELLPRIMAQELARGGGRLSPAVMLEFFRVFSCTKKVMDLGRANNVFGGVNPVLAHLNIVGTLAFALLSRSARSRAGALEAAVGVDWDFSREDVIGRVLRSYGVEPKRGGS